MAASNRAAKINKLVAAVKKQYKPVAPPNDRGLLEHLLFACLLENSPHDAAEKVFATLQKDYFDLNEVRVSTKRELAEVSAPLHDPDAAADRLKRVLHSVFEANYTFDLEEK